MPSPAASLVICYAPEDAPEAHAVGRYLAANLPYSVALDECVIGPDLDLVEATERALSAEVALVLLSPHSVPRRWKRDQWEPVFFHKPAEFNTLLGFVQIGECSFPELIRKRNFYDGRNDLIGEARRIRRWLLRPEQQPERAAPLTDSAVALRSSVGDKPGTALDIDHAVALAFASACGMDFEGVHRIDCLDRSRAGILGDIGHIVQLKLPGTVEENRAALVEWCGERRRLFLIDNARRVDREFLTFGGLVSAIFTTSAPDCQRPLADEIGATFFAIPRNESACQALIGDAAFCVTGLLNSDFESGLRLGWMVVSALRAAERFAEAVELLDSMETAARAREDSLALYKIEWEQSWLRETSPEEGVVRILPTAPETVTQLSLF